MKCKCKSGAWPTAHAFDGARGFECLSTNIRLCCPARLARRWVPVNVCLTVPTSSHLAFQHRARHISFLYGYSTRHTTLTLINPPIVTKLTQTTRHSLVSSGANAIPKQARRGLGLGPGLIIRLQQPGQPSPLPGVAIFGRALGSCKRALPCPALPVPMPCPSRPNAVTIPESGRARTLETPGHDKRQEQARQDKT